MSSQNGIVKQEQADQTSKQAMREAISNDNAKDEQERDQFSW